MVKSVLYFFLWFTFISSIQGQLSFTDVTSEAGLDHHYLGVNDMGGGAAFFDMDNDGDQDLWLSGGLNRDALYENDGAGQFIEIGASAGLQITNHIVTNGVITGDVDNDGWADVLLITHRGFHPVLLQNNGDKTFRDRSRSAGLEPYKAYGMAAAMADINLDGYLDIYCGDYIERDRVQYDPAGEHIIGFSHDCHPNRLFLNNGDWTFTEIGESLSVADKGCALATAFSDYDSDHDPDIVLANDFGAWIQPNRLFENQQLGSAFEDVSDATGMNAQIYGMGIAIGDYDGDLDLDYYITNLGPNVLLQNQGSNKFIDKATSAGVDDTYVAEDLFAVGWGTAFVDFDNDSDLDLYVVNGYVPAASFIDNPEENPNRLFLNSGQGFFESADPGPEASALRGRGLAYADIDADGDIDFLVANTNRQATSNEMQPVQLFRNELKNGGNWLEIVLEGKNSNRDGCGSLLLIHADGTQILREVDCGYGTHTSQHSRIVHVGLGPLMDIDSITVTWPDGSKQVEAQIDVNQLVTISENSQLTSQSGLKSTQAQLKCYPNPFRSRIQLQYSLSYSSTVEIRIFDSFGKLLFNRVDLGVSGEQTQDWKIPYPGSYIVTLRTDRHLLQERIVSL